MIINKSKNWKILDNSPLKIKGKKHFKCECSCGNIDNVYYLTLVNENTKACNKCSFKVHEIKLSKKFINKSKENKTFGDISGTFYAHIKRKAKERNLEFKLTKEFLWYLFLKQNKKCALSNLDINISKEIKYINYGKFKSGRTNWKLTTASLDRIDSSKGYVEGNVQWVHKDVNFMKQNFNEEYFIKLCLLICKNKLIPSQAKSILLEGVETTGEV